MNQVWRIAVKVAASVAVILAAASVTFFAQLAVPGDRATALMNLQTGQEKLWTAEELAPLNERFGFDDPILVQYLHYLTGLFQGDLGTSYTQKRPVADVIGGQLPPSLILTVAALAVAWLLALGMTLLTVKRGRFLSGLGSAWEALTASLPHYWVGVVLLVVFAVQLRMFPIIGGTSAWGSVLPVLTLAIPLAGFLGQVTRDEFVQVLRQPFVTTARSRGMSDLGVRLRHVLRHAVLPAITLSGWALGALVSGAVITENIFGRPGIGQVLVTAVNTRDLPTVSGIVLVVAAIYVVANLLVDLAYAVVDPRLAGAR
ncbi:ABC transporter permease [Amorphoplanes digitatis]|uniref:Peptide/nickel transport system permease protein n=1 Tax=Actinoplanes digitatis TaxID=1868 RepID=A0A7W7MPK7_9ACTN|nr:ABC transporter permease [Actinoplanes digitatis]MBB4761797.1 peptide/nickel transport system permease protein [Actinoplanes digitatis]GID90908.1 ABC transporter permease [Actinoplanes digitatis]